MCGLVFVYDRSRPMAELQRRVSCALDLMVHRGPDDSRLLTCGAAVLGHRRLSIIDLASSQQPMQDESGRYTLIYNGELYNYRELRKQLLPQWAFKTQGDTEVVLAGMAAQGTGFLDKMDGMWAFALWDSLRQDLLLVRDRVGKKPLYYAKLRDGIACASELPALRAVADAPWSEDMDSTADYLRYGYYVSGKTAYLEVFEVLPGHCLSWSPGREPTIWPYWSLPVGGYAGTWSQGAKALEEKLIAAVGKRLVADVEVGAFLSGGVDSTLIASLMARVHRHPTKTFTIGFDESSYDESSFASDAAKHCGTQHYCEPFDGWELEDAGRFVLRHIGQPFADSSLFPAASVSRLASCHLRVVLSGDGGDELFSGYQRYRARALLRWYSRLPAMLRKAISRSVKVLPEPFAHHSRSLLKKAHLFLDLVNRQQDEALYVAPLLYSQAALAELAPDLAQRGQALPGLPEAAGLDEAMEMMSADVLTYLPQDILVKLDRATMAHSLEARTPFLDREVMELAFSFPGSWHGNGWAGKQMLRQGLGRHIPDSVWNRRKQGFAVPISVVFPKLCEALRGLLEEPSPLDPEIVRRMIAEQEAGHRDHGHKLWGLYSYLLWRSTSELFSSNSKSGGFQFTTCSI